MSIYQQDIESYRHTATMHAEAVSMGMDINDAKDNLYLYWAESGKPFGEDFYVNILHNEINKLKEKNTPKVENANDFNGFRVFDEYPADSTLRQLGKDVFWHDGNSYLLYRSEKYGVLLASVNGIGEVRWYADKYDASDRAALAYFGLNR